LDWETGFCARSFSRISVSSAVFLTISVLSNGWYFMEGGGIDVLCVRFLNFCSVFFAEVCCSCFGCFGAAGIDFYVTYS